MQLNIEKAKDKLLAINEQITYRIKKKLHNVTHTYFNVITINGLIEVYINDGKDEEETKADINSMTYFAIPSFTTNDFDNFKFTLDFIKWNEQVIKNALFESMEEEGELDV